MTIAWNIVNHTGEAFELVSEKIRRKIVKLETLLRHFPQDAVHLQITLDEESKRKAYVVGLNLRVPSNVLHVSKESKSLVKAIDEAVRTLLLQLEKDKSRRRREHLMKHRDRKAAPPAIPFAEKPLAQGTHPQSRADLIQKVLAEDYERLLRFVSRQIHGYVAEGRLPRNAVDPRDIVDQVADKALSKPEAKPADMTYPAWCTSLAFKRTRETVLRFVSESARKVPVDMDLEENVDGETLDGLEIEEYALSVLHDAIEPEEATLGEYIADTRAAPSDVTLGEKEMLATLRESTRAWPQLERSIFEMHYLEGLSAAEIAVAMDREAEQVKRSLSRIQNTLRRRFLQIADSG
jgi:ribosomal subunit interface protein